MYLPTGHIFTLPDDSANELKEKFPDDYKIIEKNGKKYKDKIPKKKAINEKSIYSLVVEE
jgi:hypothetical protein